MTKLDLQSANPSFDEEALTPTDDVKMEQGAGIEDVEPSNQRMSPGEWWAGKNPSEKKKVLGIGGIAALALVVIIGVAASGGGPSSQNLQPTSPPTPKPTLPDGFTMRPTNAPTKPTPAPSKGPTQPPSPRPGFETGADGFSNRGDCPEQEVVVTTEGYTGGREYPTLAAIMNKETYEEFLLSSYELALSKIELSISPEDTLRGSVVAATTGTCPDYKATWARDQALTFSVVMDQYESHPPGIERDRFEEHLKDYAYHTHQIFLINKGLELGEPKYNLDGTKFSGAWCRPQTDGPASRALVLMRFARKYMEYHGEAGRAWVEENLYPSGDAYLDVTKDIKAPIKRDLDYMTQKWDVQGDCEIWEEVHGRHFYDRLVARRALINGAKFAHDMGDAIEEHKLEAVVKETETALETHWDSNLETIITGFEPHNGEEAAVRVDDIQTTLAIAHSYAHEDGHWHVKDPRSIANAFYTINAAFNYDRFTINVMGWKDEPELGVALGRYTQNYPEAKLGDYWGGEHGADGCAQNFHLPPEVCPLVIRRDDSFCPGQPWFLATNGMSEFLWEVIEEYESDGEILVNELTKGIFEFYGAGHVTSQVTGEQTFAKGTKEYQHLITVLIHAADSFIKRSRYHMGENYRMDEQYNGFTGIQSSAGDLTWSYASLMTAIDHRRIVKPRSLIESFTPEGKVEMQVFVSYAPAGASDVKIAVNGADCSAGVAAVQTRVQPLRDVSEWSAFVIVDPNTEVTFASCVDGVKGLERSITTKDKNPLNAVYLRHKALGNDKCDMIEYIQGPPSGSVRVTFTVAVPSGSELSVDEIRITGQGEDIGNWNPCATNIRLAKSGDVYTGSVYMLPGSKTFKLCHCDGGTAVWESGNDRTATVSAGASFELTWTD